MNAQAESSADLLDEALGRGQAVYDDTPGADRPAAATCRAFLAEVLAALDGNVPDDWPGAAALGSGWHASGGELAGLVREAGRLGRALEETLEDKGRLEAPARRRLRLLADDAVARAAEAYGNASRGRRDRWLSFFAHEMRNSLNTLVNAHWILRNGEGKNTAKVCDMADRAVRKLEGFVKDFRELETQARKPAPGRPDLSSS